MAVKKNITEAAVKPAYRDKAGRFSKEVSEDSSNRPNAPEDVREMLKAAVIPALKLLIDTMNDEEIKLEKCLDAATEIINRVYGKSAQPIDGSADTTVKFVLADNLKEFSE